MKNREVLVKNIATLLHSTALGDVIIGFALLSNNFTKEEIIDYFKLSTRAHLFMESGEVYFSVELPISHTDIKGGHLIFFDGLQVATWGVFIMPYPYYSEVLKEADPQGPLGRTPILDFRSTKEKKEEQKDIINT